MLSMDELYRAHANMIYRYLLALSGDVHTAEELTQETFYQAVRCIERYDGSCKETTWLCAIAKNLYQAWQRKHWRETEVLEDSLPSDKTPESDVLHRLEYLELLRQIHTLEEPGREVLYLRLFGQLSFREIGEVLHKSENWARVTFYRGKEKLKKELNRND